MSEQTPIFWTSGHADPYALLGDVTWRNYTVSSDVMLEKSGYAELIGRAGTQHSFGPAGLNAYYFRVSDAGAWSILRNNTSNSMTTLTSGTRSALGTGRWHTLALAFSGSTITASVDGTKVGTATDSAWGAGQIGYGTSQGETAQFDNLSITPGSGGGGGATSGELHAVGAGKCLDDPNSTTTPGTQQQIYTCSGAANQIWTHTSSGQLTVTVSGTTLYLDTYNSGTTAGTKVDAYTCNGGSNQQWNINSNSTVTGVQSGLCLDVTNASTANGALVELWTCNGGSNQKWTLGRG